MIFTLISRLLIFTAVLGATSTWAGQSNNPINAEINANYQRLTAAYQSLDADMMADVYTRHGFYISPGKKREIVKGREQIRALYRHYFTKVKKHNAKLQIRFRLLDRLIDTKTVSDIGYYLVTITPPPESNQPVKQHAGKFLITVRKQADGQWAFWADSNSDVALEEFIMAKPQKGLLYDSFVPPENQFKIHNP